MSVRRLLYTFSIFIICLLALYRSEHLISYYDSNLIDNAACVIEGQIYSKEVKNGKPVYYIKNVTIESYDKTSDFINISNISNKSKKSNYINELVGSNESNHTNEFNNINASGAAGNLCLQDCSVLLYYSTDDIPNNSFIKARGTINLFKSATNDGNFDEKKYYQSLGLACKVVADSVDEVSTNVLFSKDFLYRFRKAVSLTYEQYLYGEEAGIMSAMALGDKSMLLPEAKEIYQLSGIAHVLAISGLHISFVGMGIYGLFRKCGFKYHTCVVFSATLIMAYAMMTGNGVSTKRAVGMFMIYLLAQLLGEGYDMFTAACIMADIILLVEPYYVKNMGFFFSFGAVFGICFVVQPIQKSLNVAINCYIKSKVPYKGIEILYSPSRWAKMKRRILTTIVSSFSITVSTLPLVALSNYEITVYSMFLNMLVLPLMAPLLGLGLVAGLGMAAINGGAAGLGFANELLMVFVEILENVCAWSLYVCHLIIYFVEMISDWVLCLPFARVITGCPRPWQIIVYYTVLVCVANIEDIEKMCIKATLHIRRIRPDLTSVEALGLVGRKYENVKFKLILALVFVFILFIPKPRYFHVDFLDVGQGDGIYIEADDGSRIFIDGGSTSVNEVGKYRILPYLKYHGIRGIDYWFVSHTDLDHINGLTQMLEDGYKVKNLLFSYKVQKDENFGALYRLAIEKGVNVGFLAEGDTLNCKNMTINVLFPTKAVSYEGANENSLVLLLESEGQRFLFMGDTGSEQEKDLIEIYDLSDIDVLKVGHHGSKNSSCEDFLNEVKPKLAIISCGKKNRYGHPHADTLKKLEAKKIDVYRTDEMGQITISLNGGEIGIKRFTDIP